MDAVLDFLRQVMPFVLPMLLVVGQKLKAVPWVSNKLIPALLIGLNFGRLWVIRFGWGMPGTGEGQPLEGGALLTTPAMALVLGLGLGTLGSVLSFGAQLAVDHFLVNKSHKGLKYRALYKAAEATGLVNAESSKGLKAGIKW